MNVKLYPADAILPADRREILRYARAGDAGERENSLLTECLADLLPHLTYRVAWAEYPVTINGSHLNLGFTETDSADLAKNLRDCPRIVLFAATIGFAPDRLAQKYSRISPVKALFLESIGNERIETLCDLFCAEFPGARPRFSPGYGDLSLDLQREILASLDCPRKIGLTLNESLLLSPSKSVTAIMGVQNHTKE
ncbi:MAG: Vitamin B12 dependent methionine synthase activation subunit [Clostridia bacterium]|nr:Vitamin B12 dependent methionine synthase activation subunit [Clostridia bacterium]